MRTLIGGLIIVALTAAGAFSQDQAKTGPLQTTPFLIQDDLSYFANVWGLRKVSFSAERFVPLDRKILGGKIQAQGRLTYILEFDRDIHNYDLEALQRLFVFQDNRLRHVFFDADNIAINSITPIGYLMQGELSGVKGDVIRVTIDFGQDLEIMSIDPRGVDQARKVAARRG
jgi:hypothetical protein